jgi:hypothetical protein
VGRQLGGGLRGGRVRLRTGRIQFIPRAHRMRAGPYAGDSKDCAGFSLQGCIGRSGVFRTASPQRQQDCGQRPLSARPPVPHRLRARETGLGGRHRVAFAPAL